MLAYYCAILKISRRTELSLEIGSSRGKREMVVKITPSFHLQKAKIKVTIDDMQLSAHLAKVSIGLKQNGS